MRALRAGGARTLLAAALALGPAAASAAEARLPLLAGAASVEVAVPAGTPLAGYGGFPRRAWLPDLLDRSPHAFWFRPSTGTHDPIRVRSLVLESGPARVLWLAVDLVAVDPSLLADLQARLAGRGQGAGGLIVSASHTHSGPGAFARSALFGLVAVDRPVPAVRASVLAAMERAALEAERRKVPAALGTGTGAVAGIARSRVRRALDPELGVVKVVAAADGRPVAILWNYAIHGTALGRDNSLLSNDLMGEAGARLERALGAPALYVNGAVGDVSPEGRGWAGARRAGEALAAEALATWRRIRPEPRAPLALATERVGLPAPTVSVRNCLGRWVPARLRVGLGEALPTSAELLAVALGDGAWVTIPGELQTALGLEVKAAARERFAHGFVAGVSNAYLGYFLTPEDYREPSYVACGSLYGEPGGERLRDAAVALLRRLATRRDRP